MKIVNLSKRVVKPISLLTPKGLGGDVMTTYETIMIIISLLNLVVVIINSTKK